MTRDMAMSTSPVSRPGSRYRAGVWVDGIPAEIMAGGEDEVGTGG